VGLTVVDPVTATVPTLGLMETAVAPVVAQESVDDPPEVMEPTELVNEAIVGSDWTVVVPLEVVRRSIYASLVHAFTTTKASNAGKY
jgi:hypothetical protein